MADLMIGTSAYATANPELLREAGIGWVRHGFGVPFADAVGGELTEQYRERKRQAEAFAAQGLRLMGVSPGPGIGLREPDSKGDLQLTWHTHMPEWFGPLGSDQFLRNYQAVCEWLARDLRGIVSAWQIANELDIEQFAGPLTAEQACDLIERGARGFKKTDPALVVGHNPAGSERAYYFFDRLFQREDALLDYCGVDGYFGTWQAGGPANWTERVAELHELTGTPVLVNEWGFSSAGGAATDEQKRSGLSVCDMKTWYHTWGSGHTPEGQAEFVAAAFDAFRSQRSALLGVFFYRWENQEKCWQCSAPDCPAETAWGLVDLDGNPKPSFHAFKEGVGRLLA